MDKERCDKVVRILEGLNLNNEKANIHDLKLNIIALIPLRGKSLKINNFDILEKTISELKSSKYIKKFLYRQIINLQRRLLRNLERRFLFLDLDNYQSHT